MSIQKESLAIVHHGRTVAGTFYKPEGRSFYPVVIMSHGYNGFEHDFKESASYFAEHGVGAVCYTFCGGSSRDTSGYATTDMTLYTETEDLCAVLEEIKSRSCTRGQAVYFFGASQGGMVSALAAEKCRNDIGGLILLYPALCIAEDWRKKYPDTESIPEVTEFWGMKLGKRFFTSIHDLEIWKELGGLNKPVLILHGSEDTVVTKEYGMRAAQQYRNAVLEIFEGEGHGFSEAGSRRMEAMTLYFINRCEKR